MKSDFIRSSTRNYNEKPTQKNLIVELQRSKSDYLEKLNNIDLKHKVKETGYLRFYSPRTKR
jgi:hypothetical protein